MFAFTVDRAAMPDGRLVRFALEWQMLLCGEFHLNWKQNLNNERETICVLLSRLVRVKHALPPDLWL